MFLVVCETEFRGSVNPLPFDSTLAYSIWAKPIKICAEKVECLACDQSFPQKAEPRGTSFQVIFIRKFNSLFLLQVPCKNKRTGKQLASQHILKVSVETY